MIFYFTGTGNSLAAARVLARELNEPPSSMAEAQHGAEDLLIRR